jgi:magnesium chelatase accessory protein
VQQLGSGPVLLLVHGTGAATHSWRGLAPLLARRFTVVAPDLPGHGFTEAPSSDRLSLPGMAAALDGLLRALDVSPALAVGHSAGVAVLARMCLDGQIAPERLVSLNGALLPFDGLPGQIFSPVAKLLARSSLFPRFFAWRAAEPTVLARLLRETGSALEPEGVELYGRLARSPGHVAAALGMMANWDLHPLVRDLPRLRPPVILVVGGNDRTVRPHEARRIRALLPNATVVRLPGLGHLAHEERPEQIEAIIVEAAQAAGVPATA